MNPQFTITNTITHGLAQIERARGFLEAAQLSEDWVRRMSERALLLEAHHTTHIEGTKLTLGQAEQLMAGEAVPQTDADDVRELLNYRDAFHSVLISGIAQFQLVHIHPFVDGNGRTSRLLSTLCLYRAGYDFKRLFTISEYYDRDRTAFYGALQQVRDTNMDLTGWLDYFVTALATQLEEVKERGQLAIQADVLSHEHRLNERQRIVLNHLLQNDELSIQEYEQLIPGVNRRTLQRDLKDLVEKDLVVAEGSTHQLLYRLR